MSLRVSSLGPGVQALAACTAALGPVYADPLGAVLKSEARQTRASATSGTAVTLGKAAAR